MKGRPPKPAELKRLEGNPGHREIGDPVLVGARLTIADTDIAVDEAPPGAVVVGDKVYLRDKMPACPHHLVLDDELNDDTLTQDLWYEVAALLIDANIMSGGDVLVLEGLVESIVVARDAYEMYRSSSVIVDTLNPNGGRASKKAHPAFGVWLKARQEIRKIAEHYGLTPQARARLGLAVGKGRKIADELNAGLPDNPRDTRPRPDDDVVDGTIEGEEA